MRLRMTPYEFSFLRWLTLCLGLSAANVAISLAYFNSCKYRVDLTQLMALGIITTALFSVFVGLLSKRILVSKNSLCYSELEILGGPLVYLRHIGTGLLHLLAPFPIIQLLFLIQMQFEPRHLCLEEIGVLLYNLYCVCSGLGLAVSFAVMYFESAHTWVKWLRPAERKKRIVLHALQGNVAELRMHRRTPLGWLKFLTQFRINLFKLEPEERYRFTSVIMAYYLDELCWDWDSLEARFLKTRFVHCQVCEHSFGEFEAVVLIILGALEKSCCHRDCFISSKLKWAESLSSDYTLMIAADYETKVALRKMEAQCSNVWVPWHQRKKLGLFVSQVHEIQEPSIGKGLLSDYERLLIPNHVQDEENNLLDTTA